MSVSLQMILNWFLRVSFESSAALAVCYFWSIIFKPFLSSFLLWVSGWFTPWLFKVRSSFIHIKTSMKTP